MTLDDRIKEIEAKLVESLGDIEMLELICSHKENEYVPATDQTKPEYTEDEIRRYCIECNTLDWRGCFPHKCEMCKYKDFK